MSTLVDRLRDVRCNEVAFTREHAKCICRLANEAANEIERLEVVNRMNEGLIREQMKTQVALLQAAERDGRT